MTRKQPVLIYDGDCGICTDSVVWLARRADIELLPYEDVSEELRHRLPDDWRNCAHLITEKEVFSCGAAMETAYLLTGHPGTSLVNAARRLPGHARIREFGYRRFADNRSIVGRLWQRIR